MRVVWVGALLGLVTSWASTEVDLGHIDTVAVLGDSFSDNGRIYRLTFGVFPGDEDTVENRNLYNGGEPIKDKVLPFNPLDPAPARDTNPPGVGPPNGLWWEQQLAELGISDSTSYAIGAARTANIDDVPGLEVGLPGQEVPSVAAFGLNTLRNALRDQACAALPDPALCPVPVVDFFDIHDMPQQLATYLAETPSPSSSTLVLLQGMNGDYYWYFQKVLALLGQINEAVDAEGNPVSDEIKAAQKALVVTTYLTEERTSLVAAAVVDSYARMISTIAEAGDRPTIGVLGTNDDSVYFDEDGEETGPDVFKIPSFIYLDQQAQGLLGTAFGDPFRMLRDGGLSYAAQANACLTAWSKSKDTLPACLSGPAVATALETARGSPTPLPPRRSEADVYVLPIVSVLDEVEESGLFDEATLGDPCIKTFPTVANPVSVCADKETRLMWDGLHFSTRGHKVLGELLFGSLSKQMRRRNRRAARRRRRGGYHR